MKFKYGQEVIVDKLHQYQFPGAATVIKYLDRGECKGQWMVEVPSGRIAVAEERMTDAAEYWKKQNEERNRKEYGSDSTVPEKKKS